MLVVSEWNLATAIKVKVSIFFSIRKPSSTDGQPVYT